MSAQDFVFYLFAFIAVGAAVMVVVLDNPVRSALWLIANLIGVALLYFTLRAPFLMAVQLIVYAGAIVVLFVFVVMLLQRQGNPIGPGALRWLPPVGLAAVALMGALLLTVAYVAPEGLANPLGGTVVGTPTAVGEVLYRDFLLPFEATSVLLMTALVGALYLGRHSSEKEREDDEEPAESLPADPTEDGADEAAPPVRIPEDVHA